MFHLLIRNYICFIREYYTILAIFKFRFINSVRKYLLSINICLIILFHNKSNIIFLTLMMTIIILAIVTLRTKTNIVINVKSNNVKATKQKLKRRYTFKNMELNNKKNDSIKQFYLQRSFYGS